MLNSKSRNSPYLSAWAWLITFVFCFVMLGISAASLRILHSLTDHTSRIFLLDIPPFSSAGLDIFKCLVQSRSSGHLPLCCESHSLSHKFFSIHVHSSPLQQHNRAALSHIVFIFFPFAAHLSPFPSCNHLPVKLRTHAANQIFKTKSCFEGTPALKLSGAHCGLPAAAVENGSCWASRHWGGSPSPSGLNCR